MINKQEMVALNLTIKATSNKKIDIMSDHQLTVLDRELERVNEELNHYTSHADKQDYAIAVASGILTGIIDSVYVVVSLHII